MVHQRAPTIVCRKLQAPYNGSNSSSSRLFSGSWFRKQHYHARRLWRSRPLIYRYPTKEEGNKKGVLLIVTAGKDGALNGGPEFMKKVGDDFIDSIISENIPIFTGVRRPAR